MAGTIIERMARGREVERIAQSIADRRGCTLPRSEFEDLTQDIYLAFCRLDESWLRAADEGGWLRSWVWHYIDNQLRPHSKLILRLQREQAKRTTLNDERSTDTDFCG